MTDCRTCRRYEGVPELLAGFDIGHDPLAHRIYLLLLREGVRSVADLAELTDADLLGMRTLGVGALARVRECVPAPAVTLDGLERVGPGGAFAFGSRERFEDLLAAVYLYVDWRFVTRQLTGEQRELWASAVDASSVRLHAADGLPPVVVPRWWRGEFGGAV